MSELLSGWPTQQQRGCSNSFYNLPETESVAGALYYNPTAIFGDFGMSLVGIW